MIAARLLRLAAIGTASLGGLSGAAYGLLNEQSRYARRVIGAPDGGPLHADGTYFPAGDESGTDSPLDFAVLGDSSAAGLGVEVASELPGVRLATGLADELERPVRLSTHAVVGSTTRRLDAQVDVVLRDPPRLALVLIGANDVTTRIPVSTSTRLLERGVARMTDAGVAVVVGTCPDLGVIRPIPQPLRSVARRRSLTLAREQRRAVERAGGHAVPLADLLSPEFLTRPVELFGRDRFHPSAAGYEMAADLLLPTLCDAIGAWTGAPVPSAPVRSEAVEARRPTRRLVARLNLRWGHRADD
ncbi:GDSL family lipase [Actinopolyspora erythraea]|uniref:GDSL family lipase n=1 Tax=Actinopolyspora erythraea TaxID=414996 RepID=A0A099D874_9ACTN|nr:SGNH/GDSL hydrolase family protein [Actinopolyspora erythraea]ASU79923.1 GDSL family lipase [Actinopolyspora erythraea]KGI82358.1 hydrolase GDSL [Actinopolyspora erythraea]